MLNAILAPFLFSLKRKKSKKTSPSTWQSTGLTRQRSSRCLNESGLYFKTLCTVESKLNMSSVKVSDSLMNSAS